MFYFLPFIRRFCCFLFCCFYVFLRFFVFIFTFFPFSPAHFIIFLIWNPCFCHFFDRFCVFVMFSIRFSPTFSFQQIFTISFTILYKTFFRPNIQKHNFFFFDSLRNFFLSIFTVKPFWKSACAIYIKIFLTCQWCCWNKSYF